MNKFLEVLKEEVVLQEASDEIPKSIQKILAKLVYKEPFVARMFSRSHTDWIADSSIDTAGVMTRQGRIKFYYNPGFISGLSDAELNFLLQHELYHIFRSHTKRGSAIGATTGRTHYLMNVAEDSLINTDCEKDGGFGGLPMKVIDGAWFVEDRGDKYGSVEKHWQKDKNDAYTGSKQSEAIYKWMLERDKQAQQKQQQQQQNQNQQQQDQEGQGQEGQGEEGQQPPWEPSIGDVVYNKKTGKYGKVTNVANGKAKVEEISEQEAEAAVSQFKQGFKRKKKYGNLLK